MCVGVITHVCMCGMYVYHVQDWHSQMLEGDIGSPGTIVNRWL